MVIFLQKVYFDFCENFNKCIYVYVVIKKGWGVMRDDVIVNDFKVCLMGR